MKFVEKTSDGCWLWTGYIDPQGYGSFRPGGMVRSNKAHRVGYQLLVGPVAPGLSLDHLCRNRGCVNPDHLQPVTPQENTDRGASAKRSRCRKAGHEMTPENTGNRSDGRRYCKTCHRERMQRTRTQLATHE